MRKKIPKQVRNDVGGYRMTREAEVGMDGSTRKRIPKRVRNDTRGRGWNRPTVKASMGLSS